MIMITMIIIITVAMMVMVCFLYTPTVLYLMWNIVDCHSELKKYDMIYDEWDDKDNLQ